MALEYRLVVVGPDAARRIRARRDLDHGETTLVELEAHLAEGLTPYAAGTRVWLEERQAGEWVRR